MGYVSFREGKFGESKNPGKISGGFDFMGISLRFLEI